jgi:hypothetical protein
MYRDGTFARHRPADAVPVAGWNGFGAIESASPSTSPPTLGASVAPLWSNQNGPTSATVPSGSWASAGSPASIAALPGCSRKSSASTSTNSGSASTLP